MNGYEITAKNVWGCHGFQVVFLTFYATRDGNPAH
jgi:hypothetical protein